MPRPAKIRQPDVFMLCYSWEQAYTVACMGLITGELQPKVRIRSVLYKGPTVFGRYWYVMQVLPTYFDHE